MNKLAKQHLSTRLTAAPHPVSVVLHTSPAVPQFLQGGHALEPSQLAFLENVLDSGSPLTYLQKYYDRGFGPSELLTLSLLRKQRDAGGLGLRH